MSKTYTLQKTIPSHSHNAPYSFELGNHWPAGQQFKLAPKYHQTHFGKVALEQIGGEEVVSKRTRKRHRFKVVEHFNGYEVEDTKTGQSHWLSDGVDVLTTPTGKSMTPGTEYFRKTWERALNADPAETEEAYFT